MRRGLDRRKSERGADYLERIWTDPLFVGASPEEVAQFAGCSPRQAARMRHQLRKGRLYDRHHEHATLIAEQIGWPVDPSFLITRALEAYAERFEGMSTDPNFKPSARGSRRAASRGGNGPLVPSGNPKQSGGYGIPGAKDQ